MKLEDRTLIVDYIAGRGYFGTRRYLHNRCGEAHG
jgi:hypothetical protein